MRGSESELLDEFRESREKVRQRVEFVLEQVAYETAV
jgi:arsenate reductase